MEIIESTKLEQAIRNALLVHGAECQDVADHHVDSGFHDHDQDYCTEGAWRLFQGANGRQIFEATLPNPDHEYAHTTYYFYGRDEDDAVQRFKRLLEDEEDEETKPELVYCTLEQSSYNEHASCVVVYYDGTPSEEQVIEDLTSQKGKLGLSCDTKDKSFSYHECSNAVSERAKLHRYECYPCG